MRTLALLCFFLTVATLARATDNIVRVYAVDETHKILQTDTSRHWMDQANLVWVNDSIQIFGARNEIVGFQVIIQAGLGGPAARVNVALPQLNHPRFTIRNSSRNPTQYVGRYIELFKAHYAQVDSQGSGSGSLMWYFYPGRDSSNGRSHYAGPSDYYRPRGPDDVRYIPDALIPFESPTDGAPFDIPPARIQAVWVDVAIPRNAPAGIYTGILTVTEGAKVCRAIPVQLKVHDFALPDDSHFPAWAFADRRGIEQNFLVPNVWKKGSAMDSIMAAYYRMGHRHRLEVNENFHPAALRDASRMGGYFSGWRFSRAEGYEGPGENVGIPMYAIGVYDQRAATPLTAGATISYAAGAFARGAGSFIADGWLIGKQGIIFDNTPNNRKTFMVKGFSNDGSTMHVAGNGLVSSGPHTATLSCLFKNIWADKSGFADPSGYETQESWWRGSDEWESFFQDSANSTIRARYMIDEPWNDYPDTAMNLANIRTKKEWLHRNPGRGRELKIIVAGKLDFPRMFPWIDYWMPSEGVYYPPPPPRGDSIPSGYLLARAAWLREHGKHVGFYNSYRPAFGITQMIDASAGDARSGPWVAARYGIEYYFVMFCNWYTQSATTMFPHGGRWDVWARPVQYYGRDVAGPGPADDYWKDRVWGNGLLMYPGQSFFFGGKSNKGIRGPIATVRLKNWRRGQQDFEYIYLARNLGLGAAVARIVDAVVPWAIDQRPGYIGSEMSRKAQPSYPENGYRYELARKAMAELIAGSSTRRTGAERSTARGTNAFQTRE